MRAEPARAEAAKKFTADWLAKAQFNEGSWWPRWKDWLAARSGPQVKARVPGDSGAPVLCPAPGTYVVSDPNA